MSPSRPGCGRGAGSDGPGQLIESTVERTRKGTEIVGHVENSFQTIEESAAQVAALIAEITAASQQQAQGVEQVNEAVSQMDEVTQSNAANAEESASASEELSAQAGHLRSIVAHLVSMIGGAATAHSTRPNEGLHGKPGQPRMAASAHRAPVPARHGLVEADPDRF